MVFCGGILLKRFGCVPTVFVTGVSEQNHSQQELNREEGLIMANLHSTEWPLITRTIVSCNNQALG